MIVCTSICANYIPKAKALACSLKEYNPNAVFVLCLVERSIHSSTDDSKLFDFVLTAQELGIENFESFMFKYSAVEASTAVKGHLFKELLRRFPQENHFVYLDPDILVTGPFTELLEALKNHTIILTPHLCEPEENLDAIMDNEIRALKHGVFNLGFLAIRRSDEAERFIDWWSSRLREFCYIDIQGGLFTDQKWINLALCFFNVFVFKHRGYNVAPWNLSRRRLTQTEGGEFHVGNDPLRFFHFSGFDSGGNESMLRKYCQDQEDPVYKIRRMYIELIEGFGQRGLGRVPWSYDFYSNGAKVKNIDRFIYRWNRGIQHRFNDPFNTKGTPSFYNYMKYKLGLRGLWKFCMEKGPQFIADAKIAYRQGGGRLVIKKALNYFGRIL